MTGLGDLLARARVLRVARRRDRGDRPLNLSERAGRSLRVRHAASFERDSALGEQMTRGLGDAHAGGSNSSEASETLTRGEQLARGLGDTHAGRLVGVRSEHAKIVRSRIIDDPPRSCHPCAHCIELRWRYRARILSWNGEHVRIQPMNYSDHHQLRYKARRKGRLLVRRGEDYWLLDLRGPR